MKNYTENKNFHVGFCDAIKRFWIRGLDFSGRASRSEFWWAQLFLIVADLLLGFVSGGILAVLISIIFIIPGIALIVRRLHDAGISSGIFVGALFALIAGGFLCTTVFLPIGLILILVGGVLKIVIFIFFFFDSEKGRNRYGDSEKYPEATSYIDI